MCICLPNGKFNFKFSRSHSCIRKKDGKPKRTLSLISESSEEDDGRDKLSLTHRNGVKKDDLNQIQGDCDANNQGKLRQLTRDRQLPPVPDTVDFSVLQINSPRKNVGKSNSIAGKGDQFYPRSPMDDYGHIYDSEQYGDSKTAIPYMTNKQVNHFPMTTYSEDVRDVDPLYSSVLLQSNRPRSQQVSKVDQHQNAKDYYASRNDSDNLYSTIVKKDFNSLRKPNKPRPSMRDYPYQSLQSLSNQAPGLPVRLYKLSELSHLTDHAANSVHPNIRLRNCSPRDSMSGSLRRFSQPNSVNNDNESQMAEESHRDVDVLRRIQSQFNTPPTKRASLSDVRQLHVNIDNVSSHSQRSADTENDNGDAMLDVRVSDNSDFYRHITVRESLASLRARNALPENNGVLFDSGPNVETHVLPHVYEGLYETLYYSSTEPTRPGPARPPMPSSSSDPDHFTVLATRPELANPLPYLGQDNYLSITENPLSSNFHSTNAPVAANGDMARQSQDRGSVIYATTGSEVYAEISDAYLSKQYEELPDQKQAGKENGQVNNGYIGSPGTLRVLLEIQSFRHMDSDVDVSSRSTTPLHPLTRSSITKSLQSKSTDNNNVIPYSTIIRHPWFLPQRSSDNSSCDDNSACSSAAFKSSVAIKPKPIQNHLAIMTPLMERSMEGSSMFLDDNRNSEQDVDSLYDLFKRDKRNDNREQRRDSRHNGLRLDIAQEEDSEECQFGNWKTKRIVYPSFSNNHSLENGSARPFL